MTVNVTLGTLALTLPEETVHAPLPAIVPLLFTPLLRVPVMVAPAIVVSRRSPTATVTSASQEPPLGQLQ